MCASAGRCQIPVAPNASRSPGPERIALPRMTHSADTLGQNQEANHAHAAQPPHEISKLPRGIRFVNINTSNSRLDVRDHHRPQHNLRSYKAHHKNNGDRHQD
jgi:hypothetical protein